MKKISSNGPSQRQMRVAEQLRHIVADTLRLGHFSDPDLFEKANTLSVSEVTVSPDLKQATAYIYGLNRDEIEALLPALNQERNIFQKIIGQELTLKFTPKISFSYDNSLEHANKLENLIDSLSSEKSK